MTSPSCISKKWHYLFLYLLFLCLPATANASTIKPLPLDSKNAVGQYLLFFSEKEQELTLEQAKQLLAKGLFSHWSKPVLSFGIGASPHWLIAEVYNPDQSSLLHRMVIENPWLNKVDIYIVKDNREVTEFHLGDQYPYSRRPVNNRFFAFDYNYTPGTTQIFIRVETPDPMVIPVFFLSQEDASERDVLHGYSYGFLYGLVIALLLYNLILYIRLRYSRYLFYVIYLSSFLAMNLTYTGHGFLLFWPDNSYIQQWMHPFLITLYSISGIIFAFAFLQIRLYFPRIFKSSLLFCLLFLLFQYLCFINNAQALAVASAIVFVLVFTVFTFILAILSLCHRRREVMFFVIATIASLAGASITAMTVWGGLPYSELSYRAVEIGLSIDVILLSIALAEQFRIIQKEKQSALKLAGLDPMTGLYNRRAFNELTLPVLHNVKRYKHDMSLILMDIDHFKSINDRFGHNTGDRVIQATAKILQKMIRKGDISARWGGEEFIVLLPETDLNQARYFAERVRQEIEQVNISCASERVTYTVSIGIAQLDNNISSIEKLIKNADDKLYQAKSSGRNKVC